jgi:hypothetical protein
VFCKHPLQEGAVYLPQVFRDVREGVFRAQVQEHGQVAALKVKVNQHHFLARNLVQAYREVGG